VSDSIIPVSGLTDCDLGITSTVRGWLQYGKRLRCDSVVLIRRPSLTRCLPSMPEDVESVVVDDGSSDGTIKMLAKATHPNLICVQQNNRGPAYARDAGIAMVSNEDVVLTDDDCVAVSRLQVEGSGTAGAGGRVLLPVHEELISRYYTVHGILESPEYCSYLVIANCVYRRDVFLRGWGRILEFGI